MEKFINTYGRMEDQPNLAEYGELKDWYLRVQTGPETSIDLIACPEDHRCHEDPEHVTNHELCPSCELPMCVDCRRHLDKDGVLHD
eukprot:5854574-Amphidinium_carterae.1